MNSAREGIWRLRRSPAHESRQLSRLVEITSRRRVFSTFLQCCRMCRVLYDSVIHGLSFFICFMIKILCEASRDNKSHRSTNWHNVITLIKSATFLVFKTFCCCAESYITNFFKENVFRHLKMSTGGNAVKNNKTRFFDVLY